MKPINSGAYPTMITPYNNDKSVDLGAAAALTEWFWEQGCDGVFAVCLSSEIFTLSLGERVRLAETVKRTADKLAARDKSREPMSIVASGHVSNDFKEQVGELNVISDTGVDAVVLISNRFDIENTGFDRWRTDAEKMLDCLPARINLGLYECPVPYKRTLDEDVLKWIAQSGRFSFIKDTCCNAEEIKKRLDVLGGSNVKLFNAHAGSLLQTLRDGADGYCGVMANYMPKPFVKLCSCYRDDPWLAEYLQSFLTYAMSSEAMGYPISAKYYLNSFEKVSMTTLSRTTEQSKFTERYAKGMAQLYDEVKALEKNGFI